MYLTECFPARVVLKHNGLYRTFRNEQVGDVIWPFIWPLYTSVLEKRVVHLMNFAKFRTHVIAYFTSSNIMSILQALLCPKCMMSLMTLHRLASMACSLSHVKFTITIPKPLYLADTFYRRYSWLDWIITKTLLLTWWAKIWNSIPENLRKLPKHALKKQILLDLQRQDSYATDTDTFIKEILKR